LEKVGFGPSNLVKEILQEVRDSWKETEGKGTWNCTKMTVCCHCITTRRRGTVDIQIQIIDLTERKGGTINGSVPKQMLDRIRSARLSEIEFDETYLSGATKMGGGEHLFRLIISDITPRDCPY